MSEMETKIEKDVNFLARCNSVIKELTGHSYEEFIKLGSHVIKCDMRVLGFWLKARDGFIKRITEARGDTW